MSSGALQGQVAVWVPILVGLLGMAGVIGAQLVNAWREQRREDIRWRREREKEEIQRRRADYLHWREKRLEVSVELMISLNKWRELIVDRLRERHGLIEGYDDTQDQLRSAVEQTSDLLAQCKLIGTETMRSTASETVSLFRARYRAAMEAPEPLNWDDIAQVSRELSLKRGSLQEAIREELAVTSSDLN